MNFETRRQIFHLVLGNVLALLILALRDKAVYFIGTCFFVGLILSKAMHQKIKIPVFDWFINTFERKEAHPGQGALFFFFGTFAALIFFGCSIVFLSVLLLAYIDSFSTIVGSGFGKTQVWNGKSVEGTLAGFAAGFFAIAFYLPAAPALFAAAVSALAELLTPIDDNLVIPPFASLIIYILM